MRCSPAGSALSELAATVGDVAPLICGDTHMALRRGVRHRLSGAARAGGTASGAYPPGLGTSPCGRGAWGTLSPKTAPTAGCCPYPSSPSANCGLRLLKVLRGTAEIAQLAIALAQVQVQ